MEMASRGWRAVFEHRPSGRQVLHVANPLLPGRSEDVTVTGHFYRSSGGEVIALVSHTPSAADRLQERLRGASC